MTVQARVLLLVVAAAGASCSAPDFCDVYAVGFTRMRPLTCTVNARQCAMTTGCLGTDGLPAPMQYGLVLPACGDQNIANPGCPLPYDASAEMLADDACVKFCMDQDRMGYLANCTAVPGGGTWDPAPAAWACPIPGGPGDAGVDAGAGDGAVAGDGGGPSSDGGTVDAGDAGDGGVLSGTCMGSTECLLVYDLNGSGITSSLDPTSFGPAMIDVPLEVIPERGMALDAWVWIVSQTGILAGIDPTSGAVGAGPIDLGMSEAPPHELMDVTGLNVYVPFGSGAGSPADVTVVVGDATGVHRYQIAASGSPPTGATATWQGTLATLNVSDVMVHPADSLATNGWTAWTSHTPETVSYSPTFSAGAGTFMVAEAVPAPPASAVDVEDAWPGAIFVGGGPVTSVWSTSSRVMPGDARPTETSTLTFPFWDIKAISGAEFLDYSVSNEFVLAISDNGSPMTDGELDAYAGGLIRGTPDATMALPSPTALTTAALDGDMVGFVGVMPFPGMPSARVVEVHPQPAVGAGSATIDQWATLTLPPGDEPIDLAAGVLGFTAKLQCLVDSDCAPNTPCIDNNCLPFRCSTNADCPFLPSIAFETSQQSICAGTGTRRACVPPCATDLDCGNYDAARSTDTTCQMGGCLPATCYLPGDRPCNLGWECTAAGAAAYCSPIPLVPMTASARLFVLVQTGP